MGLQTVGVCTSFRKKAFVASECVLVYICITQMVKTLDLRIQLASLSRTMIRCAHALSPCHNMKHRLSMTFTSFIKGLNGM
jgi:hypothetical protein